MLLFLKVILFSYLKKNCTKKFLQWKQQVSVVRTLSSTVCFDTIKLYRSWALSSWGERRSWLFYIKQWHNVWFIRKFSLSWITVNWETLTVHFVVQQASNLNLYSTNIHPISMSNIKEGQSGRCCLNTKKTLSGVIDVIMQQWKGSPWMSTYTTPCVKLLQNKGTKVTYDFSLSLCLALARVGLYGSFSL